MPPVASAPPVAIEPPDVLLTTVVTALELVVPPSPSALEPPLAPLLLVAVVSELPPLDCVAPPVAELSALVPPTELLPPVPWLCELVALQPESSNKKRPTNTHVCSQPIMGCNLPEFLK
jgi:hypothetical protein